MLKGVVSRWPLLVLVLLLEEVWLLRLLRRGETRGRERRLCVRVCVCVCVCVCVYLSVCVSCVLCVHAVVCVRTRACP